MTQKIVHINGRLVVPAAEFERQNGTEAATFFAGVSGLLWKIWLIDREAGAAGGIYLFADEATCMEYVNGPIGAQLREYPLWTDVSIKAFDYLPAQSAITRAPVGARLAALADEHLTFARMAEAAYGVVPTIKPRDAYRRMQDDPELLVIDVRDAADIAATGTIPGALNISYGALTYQADHAAPDGWRAQQLSSHSRPVITTCILGPLGALGGKLLHDMGFRDVQVLEGGVQAWSEAGLPVAPVTTNN
jgi:rhodanese-related sulfurtransferase